MTASDYHELHPLHWPYAWASTNRDWSNQLRRRIALHCEIEAVWNPGDALPAADDYARLRDWIAGAETENAEDDEPFEMLDDVSTQLSAADDDDEPFELEGERTPEEEADASFADLCWRIAQDVQHLSPLLQSLFLFQAACATVPLLAGSDSAPAVLTGALRLSEGVQALVKASHPRLMREDAADGETSITRMPKEVRLFGQAAVDCLAPVPRDGATFDEFTIAVRRAIHDLLPLVWKVGDRLHRAIADAPSSEDLWGPLGDYVETLVGAATWVWLRGSTDLVAPMLARLDETVALADLDDLHVELDGLYLRLSVVRGELYMLLGKPLDLNLDEQWPWSAPPMVLESWLGFVGEWGHSGLFDVSDFSPEHHMLAARLAALVGARRAEPESTGSRADGPGITELHNRLDRSFELQLDGGMKLDQLIAMVAQVQDMMLDQYRRSDAQSLLVQEIRQALGKQLGPPAEPGVTVQNLIARGEDIHLEFKSTLRTDAETGQLDTRLEAAVVKSVAGLANADGGTVLIGVRDDGSVHGLQSDYDSLGRRRNRDQFAHHLTQLLSGTFGKSWVALNAKVDFAVSDGQEVCLFDVRRSGDPVIVEMPDRGGQPIEKFYVRIGNSTRELKLAEMSAYVRERFGPPA